jgi:hypothetical protein
VVKLQIYFRCFVWFEVKYICHNLIQSEEKREDLRGIDLYFIDSLKERFLKEEKGIEMKPPNSDLDFIDLRMD